MLKKHTKRVIYAIIIIVILAVLYALKNTSYFVRASTFVFSIVVFYLFDYFFKFKFKNHHHFIFVFISAVGVLLSPLYYFSPNYDKVLHLISPILFSILVFFLVDKIKIKFSHKLLITFSVVITFLALFEVGEYLLDLFFDFRLQGVYIRDYSGIAKLNIILDKNDDTMIDLILGTAGSLIFVLMKTGIYYYKRYFSK